MCVHFKCICSLACLSIFRRNDVYADRIISFHAVMMVIIYLPLKWSVIDFSLLFFLFRHFLTILKGKISSRKLSNYPKTNNAKLSISINSTIYNFLSDRRRIIMKNLTARPIFIVPSKSLMKIM